MLRALRFCGLVLLNLLVALLGTAILETALGKVIPAHSLIAVLWKAWTLSIVCAAAIGFGMWRTWRSHAAKWAWALPTLWFAVRLLPATLSGQQVWHEFSGTACGNGISVQCREFFVFTIPFIRGLSYPLGAYASLFVYHHDAVPQAASQASGSA